MIPSFVSLFAFEPFLLARGGRYFQAGRGRAPGGRGHGLQGPRGRGQDGLEGVLPLLSPDLVVRSLHAEVVALAVGGDLAGLLGALGGLELPLEVVGLLLCCGNLVAELLVVRGLLIVQPLCEVCPLKPAKEGDTLTPRSYGNNLDSISTLEDT